jgi:hypothetical protein
MRRRRDEATGWGGDGFEHASEKGVVGVRGDDGRREARAAAAGGERGVRMGSGSEGVGQGGRREAQECRAEGGTSRRYRSGRTGGGGGRTGQRMKVLMTFFLHFVLFSSRDDERYSTQLHWLSHNTDPICSVSAFPPWRPVSPTSLENRQEKDDGSRNPQPWQSY